MSKTVEIQIEKSRNLIEGLRKHLNGIGSGVTNEEINHMEKALREQDFVDVAYFEPFYLKDFIAGKPHVKGL